MDREEQSTNNEKSVQPEVLLEVKRGGKSKRGRPRIGRRSKARPPRRRRLQAKLESSHVELDIGLQDPDVAACVFSDEEERAEYLDEISYSLNNEEESLFSGKEDDEFGSLSEAQSLRPESTANVLLQSKTTSRSSLMSMSQSVLAERASVSSQEESHDALSVGSVRSQVEEYKVSEIFDKAFCDPPTDFSECSPLLTLIDSVVNRCRQLLFSPWVPIADQCGLHLLFISSGSVKAIQREIFVTYSGKVSIRVHCAPVVVEKIFKDASFSPILNEEGVESFCQGCLSVVKFLMKFDVCIGANHEESRSVWSLMPGTYIDSNPYQENKYSETCRSVMCYRLIELGRRSRCAKCAEVMKKLSQKKLSSLSLGSAGKHTPNMFLTYPQAIEKLKFQQGEIRKTDKQIDYLQKKISGMIEAEGVDVDDDLHGDLSELIRKNKNLSPVQKMFLEEQQSCSEKRKGSHRWHPSMIRLALYINMTSPAAYAALRDSGAIKLPSSRTLFDYSRAIMPQEGISDGLIKLVHDKVLKTGKDYQKFHVLIFDEMHISQNLVYREADGKLVGFTNLEDVDKEWIRFDDFVSGKTENHETPNTLATSVLAFMVKGLTSDVKCVIAAFACNRLTHDMLYQRTWQIIERLEYALVKILAIVCDGSTVNRAFIRMNTPITITKSGVIFDTINVFSPDRRPLYFISDVCHLLKTIRNGFYNSGEGENKSRCLQYNGQKIMWKSIIRLFLAHKSSNFRAQYKLNPQNVFPNSYSVMNVKYAAVVLSNTTAQDLEDQHWEGQEETVRFIRYCNKFFDCLNGAHSSQSTRKRNDDLAPYCDVNDKRFNWLQEFLDYLDDWKMQADALPLSSERSKTMLPWQTLEGIEMAIKGFTGATKYILNQGAQFIMARVFSQDPLEQHFSLQRAGRGGSRNPNVSQFLSKQVSLGLQRELGVKSRGSNVQDEKHKEMKLTNEPLPKRSRKSV